MDTYVSHDGAIPQTPSDTFQADHTEAAPSRAAETGQSSPENTRSTSDTPPGCTCGGYTVQLPVEDEDPRTGEITQPSFQRRSTAVFCPVHGVNEAYRDSYAAHAAWIATRSEYRRCDAYHVTIRLHRADVERLGLDTADTKPVLSQLLPRLRARLKKRRDPNAEVLVSMSPSWGDGRWHLHLLVLSKRCDTEAVRGVFDLAGTDTCVTTPRSREETRDEPPMSAEQFAACIGAYLFGNRIEGEKRGAETKFTSWGEGVGYFSKAARKRRREYAEAVAEAGGDTAPARNAPTRAGCPSTQFRTGEDEGADEEVATGADNGAVEPVSVGVNVVRSEAEYRRVVIRALLDRQYSRVRVQGGGVCKLTWVEVGDEDSILCYVRPLEKYNDDRRVIPWRFVEATDTPVIRRSTDTDTEADMNTEAEGKSTDAADEGADEATAGKDVAEDFFAEARYSKSTVVLPDGRRHVRTKDHETGEVTEATKPPRDERVAAMAP